MGVVAPGEKKSSVADRHRAKVLRTRFYARAVRSLLSSLVQNSYTWKLTAGPN